MYKRSVENYEKSLTLWEKALEETGEESVNNVLNIAKKIIEITQDSLARGAITEEEASGILNYTSSVSLQFLDFTDISCAKD